MCKNDLNVLARGRSASPLSGLQYLNEEGIEIPGGDIQQKQLDVQTSAEAGGKAPGS